MIFLSVRLVGEMETKDLSLSGSACHTQRVKVLAKAVPELPLCRLDGWRSDLVGVGGVDSTWREDGRDLSYSDENEVGSTDSLRGSSGA